jgi:hypothetical protein
MRLLRLWQLGQQWLTAKPVFVQAQLVLSAV